MSLKLKYRAGRRVPSFSLLILFGVAAVLSVLAWLQYGWITEVSNAEQSRLKENLAIAATRFAQDFDSEMRLLSPFRRPGRPGPPGPADFKPGDELLDRLARRHDQWISTSRHPGLLQNLFAAKVVAPGDVRLFRFDPDGRALRPVDWPPEFSDFQKSAVSESLGQRPAPGLRGMFGIDRADLQKIPALAIPIMQPQRPPDFGDPRGGRFRPPIPAGWELIRLDAKYFNDVFLPFLVQRHFSKQGDFDYDILIAQAGTGNVVYRSSANLNLSNFKDESDTSIRLTTAGFSGGPPRGGPERGGPPDERFRPEGPPPTPNAGGWQLYAKHHSGSLQSFADQFRRRNLAISFGVFAILAIGIAFTFLTSERVRAMGKLQLEFAAGLSHELRTPLAVIRSAGYNLASGKVAGTEEVVRYGNLLQEQGIRLSDMVEQALLFAQTQSGRNRYQRSPVDLTEVINRAIQSCHAILPKYSCEIKAEADPHLPLAMTDADAVNHCLHNLLVNALKYGPSPGYIRVTAKPDPAKPDSEIAIAVENRGSGINPSDLPHLFEPFFRGRNTDGVPGSGLGLYIVKSIMESLGGRVSVSSSETEGTRFTLHVPAVPSGQEA